MSSTSFLKPRKIGHRILAVVGACLALVIVAFGQFYAAREAQAIRALGERDMRRLMESVSRTVESIMLPGQASLAQSFAARLKGVPDVVDFRIVRADGSEAFRDNRTLSDVNRRLGASVFAPREHEASAQAMAGEEPYLQRALQGGREELVSYEERGADGSRQLTFLYGLGNQAACQGCHGAERAFVGAVKLSVSMAAIDAQAARTRWIGWLASTVALALALGLVGVVIHRSVVIPVQTVTAAMQRAAEGDLAQSIPVPGEDEVGQMARSFNVMIARLGELYRGLRVEQDKLHTVIKSTGEGVVVTDAGGEIVLVNDAAVRLLGKRRERIVQEGFVRLLDDPQVVQTLLERQKGDAPDPYKVSYKGRALRVIAARIRGADGAPIGSAALLREITPAQAGQAA
jgi:PAS domain S-box-containing protein